MADDDQSPLTLSEAVQAYTQSSGGRNPDNQDNPPAEEEKGQEAPEEISDDELAEGLTEEDEDNPEQEEGDGTPEEPEEKPDEEEYAAGRFAADNAKTRLADGTVTTIAELKNGNLLQSDYSRKTLALAEERKIVEETRANFATVEQAIAQQRETLAMIINRKLPKPPDPAMLNPQSGVFDVVGYMAAKEDYEAETKDIQQMIAQHQQMLAQQAREADEQRSRLRDQEAQMLFEKQPELRDPQAYQKFWARMVKYAAKRGFTPEELNEVDDHRTYQVLRDAMELDDLKARVKDAKSKINGKPQVLQGSARRSPTVVRQQDADAAYAKLKKSGSWKDGVATLLAREKVR